MSIFDDLLNANKKRKDNNGDRNTTGNTVQSQAQQQVKKADTRTIQQTNKIEKKPTQYQQILNAARERAGGSLANNTGKLAFGNNKTGRGIDALMTSREDREKEIKSTFSEDQINQAKELQKTREQILKDSHNQRDYRNAKAAMNLLGKDESDLWNEYSYQDFLPDDFDKTGVGRTLNAVASGATQWGAGSAALGNAVGEIINGDEKTRRGLDVVDYQKSLSENYMAQTPQQMYDRIVASATNNGINALLSMALGGVGGASLGTKAAEKIAMDVMMANAFGSSYGDVRTGRLGDQYTNDAGAAFRFGLGNALNERLQEAIPGGFIPGADIPSIGNFTGEMVQEGAGAIIDKLLGDSLLKYDPLTQTNEFLGEIGNNVNNLYRDENGNISRDQIMQNAKDVGQQGIEGGLGGWFGGFVRSPYNTIRQLGTDIDTLKTKDIKKAIKTYEKSVAENDLQDIDNSIANFETASRLAYTKTPSSENINLRQIGTDDDVNKINIDNLDDEMETYEKFKDSKLKDKFLKQIQSQAISEMSNFLKSGALRSSIASKQERATKANKYIAQHTAKQYKTTASDKEVNTIADIMNAFGVRVRFAEKVYGTDGVAVGGKYVVDENSGTNNLQNGEIVLMARPEKIGEGSVSNVFFHEFMHSLEGVPQYREIAELLKQMEKAGSIKDSAKMHGTERYANLLSEFYNNVLGGLDHYDEEILDDKLKKIPRLINDSMPSVKFVKDEDAELFDPYGYIQHNAAYDNPEMQAYLDNDTYSDLTPEQREAALNEDRIPLPENGVREYRLKKAKEFTRKANTEANINSRAKTASNYNDEEKIPERYSTDTIAKSKGGNKHLFDANGKYLGTLNNTYQLLQEEHKEAYESGDEDKTAYWAEIIEDIKKNGVDSDKLKELGYIVLDERDRNGKPINRKILSEEEGDAFYSAMDEIDKLNGTPEENMRASLRLLTPKAGQKYVETETREKATSFNEASSKLKEESGLPTGISNRLIEEIERKGEPNSYSVKDAVNSLMSHDKTLTEEQAKEKLNGFLKAHIDEARDRLGLNKKELSGSDAQWERTGRKVDVSKDEKGNLVANIDQKEERTTKKVVGGKKTTGLTAERQAQLEQERIDKALPMAKALTELGVDAKTAEEMAMNKASGKDYMNQEVVEKIMKEKNLDRAKATALIREAMTEKVQEAVKEAPKTVEAEAPVEAPAETSVEAQQETVETPVEQEAKTTAEVPLAPPKKIIEAKSKAENTTEQNEETLHDIIMRFHESGEQEEFDNLPTPVKEVIEEIEAPKVESKEEGDLNSSLAALYYRAGASVESANILAQRIIETGTSKGAYAPVRDEIMDSHPELSSEQVRSLLTQFKQMHSGANFDAKEFYQPMTDTIEGTPTISNKQGRLVKGDVTIASKNAEKAIKAVKEITGKEYTDEQKEAVRSAYEEFERITEEANKQAFETYQESQRQFQQKVAEEAQQARINDRVMAEEQQASQETEQVQQEAKQEQQTQQETKQEQKKAETPKQETGKKGDTSPHATVARLLKSKTLSKTVRDILKRDYVEKPVKHDRTVFGEAEELLQESGIEGAVAYANSVQPGSYFGEEAQAYLNEALVRLNAKAVDLETAIGKMNKNDPDYKTLKDLQKTYEDQSVQLCDKLLENASEAGRVVRIMRFLKGNPKLTRTYVEKLVDKLNKQYEKELNGKKLTISEDALNAYANAKTDDERAKAMDKIQYEVADQMPRNAWDMIRQWRMTSMLLNPKTHARNLISNGLTYGLFGASDLFQIGIERGLKATGIIKDSDMRAAITSKEMREAAKWLDTRDKYSYEGPQSDKFNLNQGKLAAGAFHNTNAIGKFLNKVSKLNSRLLEAEDTFFVGARAHLALAESLKAQGYSVTKEGDGWKITDKNGEKINDKVLKAMEQEALKSAQEATYHDFNKTAKAIEDFKKNAGIAGKAVDVVVPFTKTPANILRRSIEFSPVGLAKSVTWNLAQVKQGKMSASTAITQMSRGLTGTAMFALGALLANMGNLSEPEDDEDKTAYYKSNIFGKQDLALHFGDNYYSIDWAMPTASPLMMGATMANTFREHGLNILDYDLKDVLKESAKAINPVLEASYLGSLNDFVTSIAQGINYDGELMPAGALGAGERAVESVAENFVGQLTPTVGGAINRTIDSTKRTTSGNTMLERMKNRSLMNIPGMSGKLEPAIDQKGQEIENFDFGLGGLGRFIYNMAVPATITTDTHDELDNKLMEAGKKAMPLTQTGSDGLKSKIASDKTLKEAGIDLKNVSGKDYTQVKKTYYGNYRDYVKDYNELAEYNNLGTDTRDNVYGKLSNLALAESKAELLKGVGDTNDLYTDEQKAALAAKEMGVTPAQFFLMKDCGLTGNRRALYVLSELESLGVADQVYQNLLDGKTKTTAWGLTDSVLTKTADERETARAKYLEDDGQTLESMAADYRKNGKKEEETEEPTSTLAEALEKKNNKSTSKGSRKSSSGGSSRSSSISASEKAMLKLYEQILKAGTTNSAGSDIKASVSAKKASDLAAWDKVFNSEKSNVEKLRKELKL